VGRKEFGDSRRITAKMSGRLEAIHDRHARIKDDGIGIQFPNFVQCDPPVLGLTANDPFRVFVNKSVQSLSNHVTVVNQKDFVGHDGSARLGGCLPGPGRRTTELGVKENLFFKHRCLGGRGNNALCTGPHLECPSRNNLCRTYPEHERPGSREGFV
jgi:hypothetical protein